MRILFLFLGTLFGFLLSRAGATTLDFYAKLFLFEDLQLMWVIATAAAVGVVGLAIFRRLGAHTLLGGAEMAFNGKPWKKGLIVGSLIFGVGWGLSGACPGTALAMLGEGRLSALFVVGGIALGTWLYGVQQSRAIKRTVAARVTGEILEPSA